MKIGRSKADALFSEYIRRKSGGHCEYCRRFFGWKSLQCSHYFGRRHRSVRFYESNVSAICFGCHQKLGENPLSHTEWFQKRLGPKEFEMLRIKAKCGVPVKKRDEDLIIIWCKQKLKEINK